MYSAYRYTAIFSGFGIAQRVNIIWSKLSGSYQARRRSAQLLGESDRKMKAPNGESLIRGYLFIGSVHLRKSMTRQYTVHEYQRHKNRAWLSGQWSTTTYYVARRADGHNRTGTSAITGSSAMTRERGTWYRTNESRRHARLLACHRLVRSDLSNIVP